VGVRRDECAHVGGMGKASGGSRFLLGKADFFFKTAPVPGPSGFPVEKKLDGRTGGPCEAAPPLVRGSLLVRFKEKTIPAG